jgi:hypothetical protein
MRDSHEIYNTNVKEHTFWKQISILALRLDVFNGSATLSSHMSPFHLKIEANLTSKKPETMDNIQNFSN